MPFEYDRDSRSKGQQAEVLLVGEVRTILNEGIKRAQQPVRGGLIAALTQLNDRHDARIATETYSRVEASSLVLPFVNPQLYSADSGQATKLALIALASGDLFDCRTYYREGDQRVEITLGRLRQPGSFLALK